MELGEGSRTMIKAAEAARKKASKRKKAGRKYRKMEDGNEGGENEGEEGAVISEEGIEGVGKEEVREKVESILGRSNRAEPP
jgi:hypothetical protein